LFITVDNRKKKKRAKEDKVEDPKERRPEKVKPELYCDACQAIVKEAVKRLRGKKKESDVVDLMENICSQDHYYSYRMLLF
jgi:hypothetical protein